MGYGPRVFLDRGGRRSGRASVGLPVAALVFVILASLTPLVAFGQSPDASGLPAIDPGASPLPTAECPADVLPEPTPTLVPSPDPGASPAASAGAVVSATPSAAPIASASAGATDVPIDVAPRQRPLADQEVYGFLPYWELDTAAASIDLKRLTTLAWFGVEASARGELVRSIVAGHVTGWSGWIDPGFRTLMADAQAAGVRVVLTVERFSWSNADAKKTRKLLRSPDARAALVADITAELASSGADGVNLDFEPLPSEVRDQFSCFARELRTAFEASRPGLQITFDLVGGAVDSYDVAALTADDAADAAFVMGYDYRTGSSPDAGSIAPLDDPGSADLRRSVAAAVALTAPDRVILGLPWYARAWTTVSRKAGAATRSGTQLPGPWIPFYDDAIAQAEQSGRQYDPVGVSAWTAYVLRKPGCARCPEAWRQLWYDDVDSFRTKVEFALGEGLRGVGVWALGYTGTLPDLWSVLHIVTGGLVDTTPPDGEATLDPATTGSVHEGLPVVRDLVTIDLSAQDGAGESGVAFVRLSNGSALDADGSLSEGQTYPVTDAVSWSMVTGLPAESPAPRPTRTPKPRARPTSTPRPTAKPRIVGSMRVIRVQWRDVAGNWSAPVAIHVWYRTGAAPTPSTSPSPGPTPSAAPSLSLAPGPSAAP